MTQYPDYKTISLPWLSHIPMHWTLIRNKNIFTEAKKQVGDKANQYTLLSLTLNGIIPRDLESGKGKFPEKFDAYKIVKKGYMAFCLFDIDETPRTVGLSEYDGMLTGAYTIMQVHNVNAKFVYYYYLSLDNKKALKPLYTGLRKTIKTETFLGTKLPIPPREEQDQIVRFLDWKVSEINKHIVARKKEIALLEEQRQWVINNAVTHGIAPNSEFKDSGIYWIGNIPKNWEVIKIKWLFNEAEERNNDGNAVLLTFSRNKGLIPFSEASDKLPSATDLTNYKLVSPGQLLENRMQAWSGMFICVDRNGCVSPDYSVFNPTKDRYVNVKFYEYVFRNPRQVGQFANASRGVGDGFNRLYTPAFGAIYTVYPPADEQDAIVTYLDVIDKNYNSAKDILKQEIAKYQELKNRIISDVVTGQIDIRGVDIPDFDYVEETSDDKTLEETNTTEE